MAILSKLIYRCSTILSKYQLALFFTKIDKAILIFIWKCKLTTIAKTILKMENKVGGLTLCDFKSYYKATVTRIICYWYKDRHTDQCNTESKRNKSLDFWSICFWQGCQENSIGENSLSTDAGITGYLHAKKQSRTASLHSTQKWTQDGS